MQPDARPERDLAELERRTALGEDPRPPAETPYTLTDWVVIVLGFALAFGLALTVISI